MMFSDDAKAVIALTTRLGSSRRPSLTAREWHLVGAALRQSGLRPADVFDTDLGMSADLGPEILEKVTLLLRDAAATILEADELGRRGIWTLTIADEGYPTRLQVRLGSNAPPVLFGAGGRDVLVVPGIGIVGSRDVSEEGARVAMSAAAKAVSLERPVVSGGARGVDQLAMNAAYEAGGSVVGILADSLVARIRSSEVLAALDEGTTCLITQQAPMSGFTAATAMARNKLIYGLATLTLVVASAEGSGGTWAGATEAIRAENGLVAVWRGPGEGSGNEALAQRGATPVTDLDQLESLLESGPEPTAEQLTFCP